MSDLPDTAWRSELEAALIAKLVGFTVIRTGFRAQVLRCTLERPHGSPSAGASAQREFLSVIVKRGLGPASLLAHEAVGLRTLAGLAVPRLIAVLPSSDLVLEDLGTGPTLEGSLERPGAPAEAQLLATAAALGALHAVARQRVGEFARTAAQQRPAFEQQARDFRRAQPAIASFFEAAGVALDPDFGAACERLTHALSQPHAALLTVTLGDLAPSNVLVCGPGSIAFLDLEYCGVRHAFYDAMFWRCICPFPARIADGMEHAYVAALRADGVTVSDDRIAHDMVTLASHRLLWMLSWNMVALFDADRDWARPGLSTRGALLRYIEDYLHFTAERPHDAALRRSLQRLLTALSARWPCSPIEPFAVLADADTAPAPGDRSV